MLAKLYSFRISKRVILCCRRSLYYVNWLSNEDYRFQPSHSGKWYYCYCLSTELIWLLICLVVSHFCMYGNWSAPLTAQVEKFVLPPWYHPKYTIQLLTIEVLDMMWYSPENTNIDRGDSPGQYLYSMVDINVISNTSIVNNCFII